MRYVNYFMSTGVILLLLLLIVEVNGSVGLNKIDQLHRAQHNEKAKMQQETDSMSPMANIRSHTVDALKKSSFTPPKMSSEDAEKLSQELASSEMAAIENAKKNSLTIQPTKTSQPILSKPRSHSIVKPPKIPVRHSHPKILQPDGKTNQTMKEQSPHKKHDKGAKKGMKKEHNVGKCQGCCYGCKRSGWVCEKTCKICCPQVSQREQALTNSDEKGHDLFNCCSHDSWCHFVLFASLLTGSSCYV